MKTPFRRQLMFILLAAFAALPLFAAQLIAAPALASSDLAVFELKQSPDGAFSLTKAMDSNTPLELAVLFVNLDDPTGYVIVKDNALLKTWAEDARFILADNETSSATFRRVLTVDTKNGSYVLMAIYHAMNTQTLLPPTVLAQHHLNKTGGGMFLVNTQYDLQASTFQPNSSMSWGAAD